MTDAHAGRGFMRPRLHSFPISAAGLVSQAALAPTCKAGLAQALGVERRVAHQAVGALLAPQVAVRETALDLHDMAIGSGQHWVSHTGRQGIRALTHSQQTAWHLAGTRQNQPDNGVTSDGDTWHQRIPVLVLHSFVVAMYPAEAAMERPQAEVAEGGS